MRLLVAELPLRNGLDLLHDLSSVCDSPGERSFKISWFVKTGRLVEIGHRGIGTMHQQRNAVTEREIESAGDLVGNILFCTRRTGMDQRTDKVCSGDIRIKKSRGNEGIEEDNAVAQVALSELAPESNHFGTRGIAFAEENETYGLIAHLSDHVCKAREVFLAVFNTADKRDPDFGWVFMEFLRKMRVHEWVKTPDADAFRWCDLVQQQVAQHKILAHLAADDGLRKTALELQNRMHDPYVFYPRIFEAQVSDVSTLGGIQDDFLDLIFLHVAVHAAHEPKIAERIARKRNDLKYIDILCKVRVPVLHFLRADEGEVRPHGFQRNHLRQQALFVRIPYFQQGYFQQVSYHFLTSCGQRIYFQHCVFRNLPGYKVNEIRLHRIFV
jgi:hypothetical protein